MKFKEILDQIEPTDIEEEIFIIDALVMAKIRGRIMVSYPYMGPERLQWLDDNGFKHSYNKNLGEHEILIEEYT